MSAQAAQTKHTKTGIELMAMKHVNELQALGPLSQNLESTIKRQVKQLQGMSLKEQAMYFDCASQDWATMDQFVKEGIRAVTVEGKVAYGLVLCQTTGSRVYYIPTVCTSQQAYYMGSFVKPRFSLLQDVINHRAVFTRMIIQRCQRYGELLF